MAISRRKDELSMPVSSKKDEPEAKKRREDMDDKEGKMFDNWIDEIKIKRFDNFTAKASITSIYWSSRKPIFKAYLFLSQILDPWVS